MSLEGRKIFITGGAGFIGSTLIGRLVEKNQIVVYDNLTRNSLKDRPYRNHPNLKLVENDILDVDALTRAMAGSDTVVHCAAVAGIDTVTRSPITTMRVNMLGSANVLEAASQLSTCHRVVCFSTSEVYGRQAIRVSESDAANVGAVGEPRWTYAVGKLAEEHLAVSYHREKKLPTVVVRPFNVYGPGQVGEGAIRNFIQRALAHEPISIYGDGTQIRSWCYVDDMVDAVLLALAKPEAVGESFNIGNDHTITTTYQLAEMCVRITASKSKISFVERTAFADVELRIPSGEKSRRVLGFDAKVNLEDGIRRTAEYLRTNR